MSPFNFWKKSASPSSSEAFIRKSLVDISVIDVKISDIPQLVISLANALKAKYGDLDEREIENRAEQELLVVCPNCGQFSTESVRAICMAGSGIFGKSKMSFGGPNIASLYRMRCPGCGGTKVRVTFDPSKIIAKNQLLTEPVSLPEGISAVQPASTYSYFGSLTFSADEKKVAWVDSPNGEDLNVVVRLSESGKEILRIPNLVQGNRNLKCLCIGNDRILVVNEFENEQRILVALYNIANGQKVAEREMPNYSFHTPCVRHNTKTIAAVDRKPYAGGYSKGTEILLIEAGDDKLSYSYIKSESSVENPHFSPDGSLYTGGFALGRVDKTKIINTGIGTHNSICFDPTGKVFCGSGYDDRSGSSEIMILDPKNGKLDRISWGNEPIHFMEFAGTDNLLVANYISSMRMNQYPYAIITNFSTTKKEKLWEIKIDDLNPGYSPLLLSVPQENWALIQTGRLLKQISLEDGNTKSVIPKQAKEYCTARWNSSNRLLFLTRVKEKDSIGSLECYKMISKE